MRHKVVHLHEVDGPTALSSHQVNLSPGPLGPIYRPCFTHTEIVAVAANGRAYTNEYDGKRRKVRTRHDQINVECTKYTTLSLKHCATTLRLFAMWTGHQMDVKWFWCTVCMRTV
jgi:hypothetical protein